MSTPPVALLPLDDFRPRFNLELAKILADQTAAAHKFDPEYGALLENLSEFAARGGKRLRPYLVYLSYTGFDGPIDHLTELIRVAAAQELYHTAWLMHDDIIDRDLTRYGGPNIAGLYRTKFAASRAADGHHLADSMALLAGDISANLATQLMLASPFPAAAKLAAAHANIQANFDVFGGEALDVLMPALESKTITKERLLSLYKAKTASYSFRAPLQVGAILAEAPAKNQAFIPDFAEALGVAFQIADDLLGTFGDEQQLGKSVLSDLREGKRTLLHITALELATEENIKRLKTSVGNPKADHHDLAEVRTIYEACGARSEAEDLARDYVATALSYLPKLELSEPVAAELTRLATYLIDRSV